MHHGRYRLIGDHVDLPVLPGRALFDEMADQHGDVLATFAQRRQMHGKHVQSVEQVAAKLLLFDGARQIAIGGRDQPHVHTDRFRPSQALELLVFKNAQQLGL